MKVSLDGGLTFQEVAEGVRVVYEDVRLAGRDEPGEVHFNLTHEGVVTDAWANAKNGCLCHNVGTDCETAEEIASRLIEAD